MPKCIQKTRTHKYYFDHLLHPQACSKSIMDGVFKKVNITDKVILDPFCGTGTTLLSGLEKNPRRLIGTDIQPDFSQTTRHKIKGILNTATFEESRVVLEYGIDAVESIKKYDFDILVTDPPNPFMLLGFSNMRHPRDLKMTGNEVKEYWENRLVEGNMIAKGESTIKYVSRLFDTVLGMRKEIVANMFSTKSGKWSYHDEFSQKYQMDKIFGQWYWVTA